MNRINRTFENFGQKSKIIIAIRHGFKTKDGRNIKPGCIHKIISHGVLGITPEINLVQHGSDYVRTDETISAITLNLIRNGGKIEKHFSSDNRLANETRFALFNEEFNQKVAAAGLSDYEGLKKFLPEEFHSWQENLDNFIFETFAQMNPHDVCIVPAHTPVIEMLYNLYTPIPDPKLKINELEYIFIIQSPTEGQTAIKFK